MASKPGYTWRCYTCGAVLPSWAAAERHADEAHWPGGARFEAVMPAEPGQDQP